MSDPSRWCIKNSVPVFKPHQRVDPATGKLISVDVPKLYRIAANMQRLERQGGVPIRMTLGHTEPGKPETEQPPVGGYYRNARVQPFGPSGEPAVVVDEWLDPQYLNVRKNYPYRSAEYYDDQEQITGVALLTRDPYLDLGVVAYHKDHAGVTHYSRSGILRYSQAGIPSAYNFLTNGEPPMYPNGQPISWLPNGQPQQPQQPNFPQPNATPYAAPVNHPNSTPQIPPMPYPTGIPQFVQQPMSHPVQHAGPQYPTPYGTWPQQGSDYNPNQTIPHQHANTGAVYGMYATEPTATNPHSGPPFGPGTPPNAGQPMPPNDDDSSLHAMYAALTQAAQHCGRYINRKKGMNYDPSGGQMTPPQSPFPTDGNTGYSGSDEIRGNNKPAQIRAMWAKDPEPPEYHSRQRASGYSNNGNPVNYNQHQQPNPTHGNPTTITGLPVGYQMTLDQLQYQNKQLREGMAILYQDRDASDTAECVAEIRRLASQGFSVGDYEVSQLKNTPREHRPAYLHHVATHYAQIPTDYPPPILGDPTPGPSPDMNRPTSKEEMEAAIRMTANTNDPNAYSAALNYIRNGGQPTQYNRFAAPTFGENSPLNNPPMAVGDPNFGSTNGNGYADPYSANGDGGY